MSTFGKRIKARTGRRCDGCGKFTRNITGEYLRKNDSAGYINHHGRDCEHDFCEECEEKILPDYACPICGINPQS